MSEYLRKCFKFRCFPDHKLLLSSLTATVVEEVILNCALSPGARNRHFNSVCSIYNDFNNCRSLTSAKLVSKVVQTFGDFK